MPYDSVLRKRIAMARDTMGEAEKAMHSAVARLHSSAQRLLQAEAASCGEQWRDYLIREAGSNSSTWSGGPHTATNIIEAAWRSAALHLLSSPPVELTRLDTKPTNT